VSQRQLRRYLALPRARADDIRLQGRVINRRDFSQSPQSRPRACLLLQINIIGKQRRATRRAEARTARSSSLCSGDAGHVSYPLGHLVALTLILMTGNARSVNGPLKISTRNKAVDVR